MNPIIVASPRAIDSVFDLLTVLASPEKVEKALDAIKAAQDTLAEQVASVDAREAAVKAAEKAVEDEAGRQLLGANNLSASISEHEAKVADQEAVRTAFEVERAKSQSDLAMRGAAQDQRDRDLSAQAVKLAARDDSLTQREKAADARDAKADTREQKLAEQTAALDEKRAKIALALGA